MKKKFITTFLLATIVAAGIGNKAYAKTDSYLVKNNDTNIVYEFNKDQLTDSFLKFKSEESSLLFDEYNKIFTKNGLFAFHDDTQKYVDYKIVEEAFLDSKVQGKPFDLDKFTESTSTKGMTTFSKKITIVSEINGSIVYKEKELTDDLKEIGDLKVISIE